MALQFVDGYITSIHGRRLGLQSLTSGQSGSTTYAGGDVSPAPEFIIGPDQIRESVTTAETTTKRIAAFGVSLVTNAATTKTVYRLDPPIPGVRKTIIFNSSGTATNSVHVEANGDPTAVQTISFNTTGGTTLSCLHSTQGYRGAVSLLGINSTSWSIQGSLSTAFIYQSTKTT